MTHCQLPCCMLETISVSRVPQILSWRHGHASTAKIILYLFLIFDNHLVICGDKMSDFYSSFVSIHYIICECGDTFSTEEGLQNHLEYEHDGPERNEFQCSTVRIIYTITNNYHHQQSTSLCPFLGFSF